MDDSFYFTKVAALPRGEALLCGHLSREKEEPTFTRLFLVTPSGWKLVGDMPDVVYGLACGPVTAGSRPDVFVLGRTGTYRICSAGREPFDGTVPKRDVTYLEAAFYCGDAVYVCGGQNQVFRLRDSAWEEISQPIYQPFSGELKASLESIASRSSDEVLFVGDRGSVYLFDHGTWSKMQVPTNVNLLTAIRTGSAYLVGGTDGVLLSIDDQNSITELSTEITDRCRIADFTVFRGDVYAAATDKLLQIRGMNVFEVQTPNDFSVNSIACVDASEKYLWMTGGERVFRFNAETWETLLCPGNQ